jgi:glycogen(starch) synthase
VKILHLASEYPPQKVFGLGRFVHDLAKAQARRGDEPAVITNSLGGEEHDVLRDGVHVCRADFPPPPKPPLTETQVLQFNLSVISRAAGQMKKGAHWEFINAHDWYLLPAADVLRRSLGAPVCLTMHDTIVGKLAGNLTNPDKFIANAEMWGCRTADRVICCTAFMRKEVSERYGTPPNRIAVVPCGVDEETFRVRASEHVSLFRSVLARPDESIILYVGRLDPEKGIEALLGAIPEVLASEPNAKFVLAGTGRLEARVREFVRDQGLGDKVLLPGYVGRAPLAFLYRCACIQICPSLYEPFGIVALEGMINGVAVIVSDSTGLAEIVEHEADGLHFATGSSEELAKAVVRLLADGETRERLAAAGSEKARTAYDWARVAELTDTAYRDALAAGGVCA